MHKRLLQLLRDNAKREQSPLKVENAAESATIYLYDVIDPYFGVGALDFNKELAALKGKPVNLRINSPGGDVFDGRAMATAIAQHGDVTAYIDGWAASAATYVAIAAKTVNIVEGGFFMIHNAWTLGYGNKHDFLTLADLLEKLDQSIINDYVKKTGKTTDEIVEWMDAETWFTAKEAADHGFVDTVFNGAKVENKWNLSAYQNAPKPTEKVAPADSALWMQQRENAERRLRLLTID
ncbi:ATP-dependent protease ClpP, protease subunit [Nitrosospira sp. Nsp11]|uniref:head maturation protease, ClpP-related n=1 Tax=Nitrosospira sp. Nsp11 TaxID=1855338 RepID=UPI00091B6089|nr:head maturation protease, ClpP-related [Nitrosospira sp. Nsp11]SHL10579.1 ATP-dependent protease ClpP, protease subunit [Nitrosospira sp. Nsp11]